ncbi:MAG TPA: FAD-binding oxidoreductase [Candidatus Saccharimonadales bacterium]|nr:FAD-binding oxidoreductase [Candidatus Saccharimonadales bacterium]
MYEFDIAIIGGGILAYATAFSIISKEPKAKIALISGEKNSDMATLASGAMLGCYAEVTKNLLSSHAGKTKLNMSIAAAKMWPAWLETIQATLQKNPDTHQNLTINSGTFVILNNQAKQREKDNFNAIIQALNDNNETYLDVSAHDIPGFNPEATASLIKAVYLPCEGSIHSNELFDALKKATLSASNCIEFPENVSELVSEAQKISAAITLQGKVIKAEKFLLAAGAYSHELIKQIPSLRYKIPPILSGMGLSLVVRHMTLEFNANIRTANRSGACGLHVLPRGDNKIYIGATNDISVTARDNPALNQFNSLLNSAFEQINHDLRYARLLNYSIGNRAVTLDTFPLVGKTSLENLWVLSGTFRDGFHLSPLLAEIISAEMLEKTSATDLPYTIFSPERTPIQTMTQEEAIQATVDEYLSGAYEQKMHLPNQELDYLLEEILFLKFERLYQLLDTSLALPPELLIMLNSPGSVKYLKDYFNQLRQPAEAEY